MNINSLISCYQMKLDAVETHISSGDLQQAETSLNFAGGIQLAYDSLLDRHITHCSRFSDLTERLEAAKVDNNDRVQATIKEVIEESAAHLKQHQSNDNTHDLIMSIANHFYAAGLNYGHILHGGSPESSAMIRENSKTTRAARREAEKGGK